MLRVQTRDELFGQVNRLRIRASGMSRYYMWTTNLNCVQFVRSISKVKKKKMPAVKRTLIRQVQVVFLY